MQDHPLRQRLNDELHGRPALAVRPPARILHIALLDPGSTRLLAAFTAFCARQTLPRPAEGVRQAVVDLGTQRLQWERHGEFGTLTLVQGDPPTPLETVAPMPSVLAEITAELGPARLAAADLRLVRDPAEPPAALIERYFGHDDVAAAQVAGGTAWVATDLRIGPDGATRFLVLDRDLTAARAGRTIRRLLEIDTYRMLAMLAYPLAQEQGPALGRLEAELHQVLDEMAGATAAAERPLLERLTELAREVERLDGVTSFRFAAARAYHALVEKRLLELQEGSISGFQRLAPFLDRRLGPAMATCLATERRLENLGRRVQRATDLLRTRVDVALEAQNQEILAGMAQRARAQLRLQETVEGLSVVAISYYALSVIAKVVEPVATHLLGLEGALLEAALAPVVVAAVWLGLRRIRARLARAG